MTRVEFAHKATYECGYVAEWLSEELTAVLGEDHPLMPMVEHLEAEIWRAAVLLALELKA